MKRLIGLSVILIAFLAACTSYQPTESVLQTLAVDLLQIRALSNGQPLFLPDPGNPGQVSAGRNRLCLTNSFELPGQGFRQNTKPQDGGLSYDSLAFTTLSKTALTVGSDLKNSFFTSFVPDAQVANTAILVVDDFGPIDNPATPQNEGNEVYNLGNAIYLQPSFTPTSVETLQTQGALSHGALVFRHINDEIRGTGLYTLNAAASTTQKRVYERTLANGTKPRLTVIAVNVNLSSLTDTSTIANKIEQSIKAVSPTGAFIKTVVNMSFVLMPCSVYNDFLWFDNQNAGEQTLEDYMAALANFQNPPVNKNELVGAIIKSTDRIDPNPAAMGKSLDPLAKLIDGTDATCPVQCSAQNNIYVASSGNYSLNASMNPARWPKVVNVTGSSVDNPSVRAKQFFNRGEVMHIGATLRLAPPIHIALQGGKTVYYIGTSFSAPTVSVYSALDIALVQRCAETGLNPYSELAKDLPSLIDRPLETFGTTSGAVQVRCGAN